MHLVVKSIIIFGIVAIIALAGTQRNEGAGIESFRVWALESPHFSLDGTDPDALQRVVDNLRKQVDTLAITREEGVANELRESLYPLRFLETLPPLQRAREDFLANSSPTTAQVYRTQLLETSRLYLVSMKAFAQLLHTHLDTPERVYAFMDGKTTKKHLLGYMDALYSDAVRRDREMRSFLACTQRGGRCQGLHIHVPTTQEVRPFAIPSTDEVSEVRTLLEESGMNVRLTSRGIFALSGSVCTPGKSPVLVEIFTTSEDSLLVRPLNDIYFWDLKSASNNYFANILKTIPLTYMYQSVFNPYTCFAGAQLFARAATMLYIQDKVRQAPVAHTKLENTIRDTPILSEWDMDAYIASLSPEESPDIRNIVSAWHNRSGYTDRVIGAVHYFNLATETTNARRRTPQLDYLIVSRSSFLTLFATFNTSIATGDIFPLIPLSPDTERPLVSYTHDLKDASKDEVLRYLQESLAESKRRGM